MKRVMGVAAMLGLAACGPVVCYETEDYVGDYVILESRLPELVGATVNVSENEATIKYTDTEGEEQVVRYVVTSGP